MARFIKQPIGYIVGEGCGSDIMESALSFLKAIEKITGIKFRLIEYKGEAPALKYTTKSYNQLKSFYKQIKKRGRLYNSYWNLCKTSL